MSEKWKIFWADKWFLFLTFWGASLWPVWITDKWLFYIVLKFGSIFLVVYLLILIVLARPTLTKVLSVVAKRYFVLLSFVFLFFYFSSQIWIALSSTGLKMMFVATCLLGIVLYKYLSNLLIQQLSWPSFLKFTKTSKVEDWVASKTPQDQGTDAKQIPLLKGSLLKSITFSVRSTSNYWRAGIKFTDVNGSILPLRQDASVLFHLYKDIDTLNHLSTRTYITKDNATDTIIESDPKEVLIVRAEINENSVLKIYVNDKEEFSHKFNSSLYSKVFLLAWGDSSDYTVEFFDIKYKTK